MKSKRRVISTTDNQSNAQVSSITRPTLFSQMSHTKNKLALLEEFRFILGNVNLEGMCTNPNLLSRSALNSKIEQFYDETFRQILKARSVSAIDPGKALSRIFNKTQSLNQIQFWQSICNFLYTAAKFSESREVGLFILFLKANGMNKVFVNYICLRQYFKMITLIDPSKEKDVLGITTSNENIIRIMDKSYSADAAEYEQILNHLNNIFDCQKQIGYLDFLQNAIMVDCPKALASMVNSLITFYHSVSEKEPTRKRESSPGFTRRPFVLKEFDLEPPENAFSKRSKSPITYIVRLGATDKHRTQVKPTKTETIEVKKPKKVSMNKVAMQRVKVRPKSDRLQLLFHTIDQTYNNKYRGAEIDIVKELPKNSINSVGVEEKIQSKVIQDDYSPLPEQELVNQMEDRLDEHSKILHRDLLQKANYVSDLRKSQSVNTHNIKIEEFINEDNQLGDDSGNNQTSQSVFSIRPGINSTSYKESRSQQRQSNKVMDDSANLKLGSSFHRDDTEKRKRQSRDSHNTHLISRGGLNDISTDPRARDSMPSESYHPKLPEPDNSRLRSYAVESITAQSQTIMDNNNSNVKPVSRSVNIPKLVHGYPNFEIPQSTRVESERLIDCNGESKNSPDLLHRPDFKKQNSLSKRSDPKESLQESASVNLQLLSNILDDSNIVPPDLQTPLMRESRPHIKLQDLTDDKEPEALLDINHSDNSGIIMDQDANDSVENSNDSHSNRKPESPNKSTNEILDLIANKEPESPIENSCRQKAQSNSKGHNDKKSDRNHLNVPSEFEELMNYSIDIEQLALSIEDNDREDQILKQTLGIQNDDFAK
jgi:hypothetical protein